LFLCLLLHDSSLILCIPFFFFVAKMTVKFIRNTLSIDWKQVISRERMRTTFAFLQCSVSTRYHSSHITTLLCYKYICICFDSGCVCFIPLYLVLTLCIKQMFDKCLFNPLYFNLIKNIYICCAGNWTQNFTHANQVFYQWAIILCLSSFFFFVFFFGGTGVWT
jgi:hypothetical protein